MIQRSGAFLLVSVVVAAVGSAADFREVPIESVGFIGPIETGNSPETTSCRNFGYSGSVGFPYRNRSLVVDLGAATLVHRIVLVDDYSDHHGTSPTIAQYGLRIYTSDDNRTYKPYTGQFKITIRSGKPEGAFDVVVIDGLTIAARYIKFHQALPNDEWDFANRNLQRMVRVYQDRARVARIVSLVLPRYAPGRATLRARVQLPKVRAGAIVLDVVSSRGRSVGQCVVPRSGEVEAELNLQRLGLGLHELSVRVLSRSTAQVLARAKLKTYVCASVVENPIRAASVRPGQVVLLTDLQRYADSMPAGWRKGSFVRGGEHAARPLWIARADANELAARLPVDGWCAVSVGLVADERGGEIVARLGVWEPWRRCRLEVWREHDRARGLGEAFVGCADLHGATLYIRPRRGRACRVAFVRLLGLTDEQRRLVLAARRPNTDKRVIVNNDGYSMFFSGVNSKERIWRMIDRYAGLALYEYDYGLGADASCTYATKVATVFGTRVKKFWRRGDRRAYEAIQKLIREGNDPLRVVIERCHARGIRVCASFRMNACYGPTVGKTFNGELYWRYYDRCRVRTRWGRLSYNLSYAYPEVRAYRLAIIREAAMYGPDGIHLDFLRHPPFVGNDAPLAEAFRKKYGEPLPKNPFDDPRWQRLRAEVMTRFVRDVRRTLDEVGQKLGRRLALSASFDYAGYRGQGLDVERWIREGLLDNISPGVHGLGGKYFPVRQFARMVRGTRCKLFVRLEHTIRGHDPTPESERGEVHFESERMTLNLYRARALELYDEGADGIYLFNTAGYEFINALSDVAGLRAWNAVERPLVGWFDTVE